MKVCIYCGEPIKPDEPWTEDPVGSGKYWHSECHYKAVKEWEEKYKKGETAMGWDEWVREMIIERGYRGEEIKKVKRIDVPTVIREQIKDIFRIGDWWFKFVERKITADELWKILVEPEHSARVRANWLPEYKDVFLKIADDIKKFREHVAMYRDKRISFGDLVNVYRELRKNLDKLELMWIETTKPHKHYTTFL